MHTKVVRNWQPSKLDAEVISREFREVLSKDFNVHEIRIVSAFKASHSLATTWHFDDVSLYTVIWSNKCPTEVILSKNNGNVFLETTAGDIIVLNNSESLHRMPLDAPPERWVAWAEVVLKEGVQTNV